MITFSCENRYYRTQATKSYFRAGSGRAAAGIDLPSSRPLISWDPQIAVAPACPCDYFINGLGPHIGGHHSFGPGPTVLPDLEALHVLQAATLFHHSVTRSIQ
jgi:hypothetical protein